MAKKTVVSMGMGTTENQLAYALASIISDVEGLGVKVESSLGENPKLVVWGLDGQAFELTIEKVYWSNPLAQAREEDFHSKLEAEIANIS